MKKYLAVILALTIVTTSVFSQFRRSKAKEPSDFAEHVWFGANINDLRFSSNTFSFGVTPMAAIEVTNNVSFGLLFKVDYFFEKYRFTSPQIKYSSLDFGPGVFARVDILDQFFGQLEFEHAFLERPLRDNAGLPIPMGNEISTQHIEQNFVYIGAGYSSGSRVKYNVSIHYNILDDFDSERFPWDYRFGISWPLK